MGSGPLHSPLIGGVDSVCLVTRHLGPVTTPDALDAPGRQVQRCRWCFIPALPAPVVALLRRGESCFIPLPGARQLACTPRAEVQTAILRRAHACFGSPRP